LQRQIDHLRETNETLRSILEATPDVIITVDQDGEITYMNRSASAKDTKQRIGTSAYDYVSLAHQNDAKEAIKHAFDTGEPFRLEVSGGPTEQSDRWWFDCRMAPLKKNGEVVAVSVISTDITKRKHAEEALQKSNQRQSAFMDASPDAWALWDSKLNLVDINQAGLSFFPPDTKKEDVVGKNIQDFHSNIVETNKIDKYLKTLRTGESFFVDNVVPDLCFGDRNLAVRGFKVGDGLGIIITDITDRKKNEIELKNSEHLLREQKHALEQKTFALREVVAQIEAEKNRIKEDMLINVRELFIPLLQKVRTTEDSKKYLEMLSHQLEQLAAPFGRKLTMHTAKLAPREIQICAMVKSGLTNKDIASFLNISPQTIGKHRKNIRKKLNLTNKTINLHTYLLNM
ncbi:MAG: PAS domain-containing protein, partial [Pseudomonadota bacterium]